MNNLVIFIKINAAALQALPQVLPLLWVLVLSARSRLSELRRELIESTAERRNNKSGLARCWRAVVRDADARNERAQ